MTPGTFAPIETIQRFTPIGVELWDLLTSSPISDGLVVAGRVAGNTGRFRPAVASPRGVHSMMGLPGLRALEDLRPPTGEFLELPTAPMVEVDLSVADLLGRFLPTMLRVEAPQSGLATAAHALAGCAALALSVPDDQPPFLLSAPTRSVPSTTATVRTHLRDRSTGAPAAHALISVTVDGRTYTGAADDQGQVLVPFPYPPFFDSFGTPSIPAGEGGRATNLQSWPLAISVRSQPISVLAFSDGVDVPFYHSLFCQPPGAIWADEADADPVPSLDATLEYGRELFLRTDGIPESELLIDFAP